MQCSLKTETTAVRERMASELKIARDIQMGILPKMFPAFPNRPEFDLYATIVPAREVGGDLYDFFFLDHDRLFAWSWEMYREKAYLRHCSWRLPVS